MRFLMLTILSINGLHHIVTLLCVLPQWALLPETYSRQNSNWILEMTSGFQPVRQQFFSNLHYEERVFQSSWTCFSPWQLVCLPWPNILMQTFHCLFFLAGHFWGAQTDSMWLSTHNSQHLLKMIMRTAHARGPPWSHCMHLHDAALFGLN